MIINNTEITILIIEDEEVLRNSMSDYLEDRDYLVLRAENGRIGIDILKSENPDLILTDLRMPEVGGLEVLQKSREFNPDIPIIVVSGTGRIQDSIQALRLGAWDYILKPVEDMSIITHAIDRALERARLLKENYEYQKELEKKVAARTKELKVANKNLISINARLHKVVESTRKLTSCSEIAKLGSSLLKEFAEHMKASGGSIYLVEKEGMKLYHVIDPGHAIEFIPFPIKEDSIFGRVLKDRNALLIADINGNNKIQSSGWNGYTDGSILSFPLLNQDGGVFGVITLHSSTKPPFVEQDKDIGRILASYSRESFKAVKAMEEMRKFKLGIEESSDAIFITSIEGDIIYINPAFEKTYGYKMVEVVGLNPRIIKSDLQTAGFYKNFWKTLLSKKTVSGEITNRTKTGCLISVEGTNNPILNDEGNIIGFIGIHRDVTLRKETEAKLNHSQRMDAIGQLAGGIAHDFNNMLSGILGTASFLAHRKNNLDDKTLEYIEIIIQASKRASELVSKLLTFGRKEKTTISSLSIHEIIYDSVSILKSSINKRTKIKVDINATEDTIMGDNSQVQNILMNLCINSNHAMPDGGNILIETKNVLFEQEFCDRTSFEVKPGKYIEIKVKDNGYGISPENLKRVFEPFFTTKKKGEGTGLGLSTIYGTVKSLNGIITVKSKLEMGTIFQISLPLTIEKGMK